MKASFYLMFVGLLVANSIAVSAQTLFRQSEPQVLSPTATEMRKYGEIPINYFNGLPEISIPLTEVAAKGYTLPVYLTYHASGNKPDQHPGWVGQGWTLHAGGSITRVIKGGKDEMSKLECEHLYGVSPSYEPGYLYHAHRVQENINWNNLDTLAYHTVRGGSAFYDNEPDEFYLNLEGIQATFYITGEGEVKIVSRGDASFDVNWTLGIDANYNALNVYEHPSDSTKNYRARRYTYFNSFSVRDREGNTYFFGGPDDAIEYSVSQKAEIIYSGGSLVTTSSWDATATANAWMLTKIIRPDGEVISFTYKHEDSVPIVLHDFHYGEAYHATAYGSLSYSYDTYPLRLTVKNNLSFTFLLPTYLESISCRVSGDHLTFCSSPSTELGYSYSEEDFERRIGNHTGTTYSFSFNDFMAKNYYLKLDSISGEGKNIAFSYSNSSQTRLKLRNVRFLDQENGNTDHQYKFKYNALALPGYNSRMTDRWGFYNGQDYSSTISSFGHNMYATRAPNATYMQAEMLTDIYYPTGGRSSFEYEPHSYYRAATQFPFGIESCPTDSLAGGLRIKQIMERDSTGVRQSRSFTYVGSYSGATHSSGILAGRQRFTAGGSVTVHAYDSQPFNYSLSYAYYNEQPFNRLSETDGNHVTYSIVQETFSDGGRITYKYSNHDTQGASDNNPTARLISAQTDLNLASGFNSGQLFRGLLLERQTTTAAGWTVQKEEYSYNFSQLSFLKSISKFLFIGNQIGTAAYSKVFCGYPSLTQKKITHYQDFGSAITETFDYEYNADRRETVETHTVGSDTDGVVTFYPEDRSGAIYTAMQQAGMSGIPVGQAQLQQGRVIAAQEITYKEINVSSPSGSATCLVPDASYTAEFSSPVSLSSYRSNPAYYRSDPDIRYLRYDNHANLIGTETRDGVRTTFAWDESALHPTMVARGVNPGETTQQDVSRNESYPLPYAQTSYHRRTFETMGSSSITISVSAAYGYAWLILYTIDGQAGYLVSYNVPATPTQQWMQYLMQYTQSVQINLPAGSHQFSIEATDWYKISSASANPAGTVSCSFKETDQVVVAGETLAFYDFENESGSTPGYHSEHAHYGSYTINMTVPSDRSYVVDYMLNENNVWNYYRETYSGGSKTLGAAGKPIDNIRVFPTNCDITTAGYDKAGPMRFRTDARGVTESYEYDGLRRLISVKDNQEHAVESYLYHYASGNDIRNSIRATTYTNSAGTSNRSAIQYLDSLGRPVQQVLVNGAATGWDLVTYQDYDTCGRELRKWLPAPVQVGYQHAAGDYATLAQIQTGGNNVYPSNDPYRYEQIIYEASPRNRMDERYGPGADWRGTPLRPDSFTLRTNIPYSPQDEDYYRGFSISWTGNTSLTLSRTAEATAGTLQIYQTEDEDGQITLEFKNAFGQTVLLRNEVSVGNYLDTHFVYDNLGRLAAVLPPEFVNQIGTTTSWNYDDLANLAYLYRYDTRGNCIARSLPGAGWTYMVYDKGNRLVLTQNAAQRAQSTYSWTFTIPDHLGREALRGTATIFESAFSDPYKSTVIKATLPVSPTYSGTYKGYVLSGLSLSSPDLLAVNYYDAYGFAGNTPFPASYNPDFAYDSSIGTDFSAYYSPSAQGLLTGSLQKVLDNTAGNQYLWSVSYFDDKTRVVQHRASTHLGGVEKVWFLYDFIGNTTKRKTEHKPSSGTSLVETTTQSYDSWDRPLVTQHQIGSGSVTTISNKTYDKVGRLISESRNGTSALASTYQYNIRSWLTVIAGSLFNETLKYQDGPTPRWGGDISQLSWTDNQSSNQKTYSLAYDSFGRLTTASFSETNSSASFAESVTGYDGNGNITGLQRYGRTGASSYGLIDNLSYTYSGNRLSSVYDSGSAAYGSDFCYANGSYSYSYDAAGRMTSDASKGITSISWNVLGLPQTVTFSSGAVINYSYAADGTKLREARTASSTTTTTDYTGNLILENGTRSRLLYDGGYVSVSNSGYYFFITDHLGSVRVVANASGTAEEYNHYYPLGGPIAQYSSSTSIQPIKFQSKEWSGEKGLTLYDFGARRYDPATGRWISQDPMAEEYYAHSPYLFCAANPMRFVDPTGRSTRVRRLDDGRFEVIGGELEDSDLGIYVGELDQDGVWKQTEKDAIGYSATLCSFYNTDDGENHGWQIGAIIDPRDNSGQRFMNRFGSYSNLLVYMLKARTNHSWDFKVTNGVSKNPINGISIYRGMPITIEGNSVYASARDVGNIVAGYVGGINGLSWESFRFGCDFYQSALSSLKNGSLSREVEGMSTTAAQRLGWEKGNFSWNIFNALRK